MVVYLRCCKTFLPVLASFLAFGGYFSSYLLLSVTSRLSWFLLTRCGWSSASGFVFVMRMLLSVLCVFCRGTSLD